VFNFSLIDYLKKQEALDFLGLNYYYKQYVASSPNLFGKECRHAHHQGKQNTLGWYRYPQGLYQLLLRLKSYDLPIIITENGTSELQDEDYEQFLLSHLRCVGEALTHGVRVWGYMWWSLLDNFEWDKGYDHRFGLIEVDFKNCKRTLKPFATTYKNISQTNEISI
jgi:beta-glucosidase